MGRGKKKQKTDSLRHLTLVSCNCFLIFSVPLGLLFDFQCRIRGNALLHHVHLVAVGFTPHYINPSLRSFCLLKVAHLFDCVSLTVRLGSLGDLDSALSLISLSILCSSSLYSLRRSSGSPSSLTHILFPPFKDWFASLSLLLLL